MAENGTGQKDWRWKFSLFFTLCAAPFKKSLEFRLKVQFNNFSTCSSTETSLTTDETDENAADDIARCDEDFMREKWEKSS